MTGGSQRSWAGELRTVQTDDGIRMKEKRVATRSTFPNKDRIGDYQSLLRIILLFRSRLRLELGTTLFCVLRAATGISSRRPRGCPDCHATGVFCATTGTHRDNLASIQCQRPNAILQSSIRPPQCTAGETINDKRNHLSSSILHPPSSMRYMH